MDASSTRSTSFRNNEQPLALGGEPSGSRPFRFSATVRPHMTDWHKKLHSARLWCEGSINHTSWCGSLKCVSNNSAGNSEAQKYFENCNPEVKMFPFGHAVRPMQNTLWRLFLEYFPLHAAEDFERWWRLFSRWDGICVWKLLYGYYLPANIVSARKSLGWGDHSDIGYEWSSPTNLAVLFICSCTKQPIYNLLCTLSAFVIIVILTDILWPARKKSLVLLKSKKYFTLGNSHSLVKVIYFAYLPEVVHTRNKTPYHYASSNTPEA